MLFFHTASILRLFFLVSSTWEKALFTGYNQIPVHQLVAILQLSSGNSHLNTHILQTVFLMHPFPFPSPTAKWQEDELQFLSPALCSPAQLSDQCQICLVPQAQMTVWLQLPKLLHCVIPLSLISFSMRLKPNIRGNKITDQWVYVHKDFGHPLFPQALILPSSIKSTQI